VAHEINNPITTVLLNAEMILEDGDQEGPVADYTREIIRETHRVAGIVRNLLSFARQEQDIHEPVEPRVIIEGTLSLISTLIKRDHIQLEVNVPDDLPEVWCHSQKIQQVLMNLMTNARDSLNTKYPEYHPDKKFRLSACQVSKEGRPWLRLSVEDHGMGIKPEVRERMFEPFFTTKHRTEGTGLGLSVSHGIVQEHKGALWVETEVGAYTRFHLDLPLGGVITV